MNQDTINNVVKPVTINLNMLRICLLLTVGLILSGCREEEKAPQDNNLAGVYTLVTVNGSKLPAKVSHGGTEIEVRSGAFTINADGTCGSRMVFVPPHGTEATRDVKATFTREGAKLNMQWEGAGRTTGTIEGATFTMNNEGMVFVFKK